MSGRDTLLEYAFPIEAVAPIAAPSKAYLKHVCLVVKPKTGQEGNVGTIYECANSLQVAERTDNINAQQLFDAGLIKTFILLADDLNVITPLASASSFFTLLISDDFNDDEVTKKSTVTVLDMTFTAYVEGVAGNAISISFEDGVVAGSEFVTVTDKSIVVTIEDGVSTADQVKTALDLEAEAAALITTSIASGQGSSAQSIFIETFLTGGALLSVGTWGGVVGVSSDDVSFLTNQAILTNRTAFFGSSINKASNMCFAFGKLLSGIGWKNKQYLEMPLDDGIDLLTEANNLFEKKISFVLNSDEYNNRLALFTNNRKAIVAPYIYEYFQLSLQGWGVQYIALNEPSYTIFETSLLQSFLQKKAEERFVASKLVDSVAILITLVEDNFMANGDLTITEPKALWRVNAKLQQGLI
tara:strand:- start:5487 stop:6728 length:1242 start_codon:yes stop_codon:yes gene_type:complete